MSHPERLLTSQELHNFRVFLSANPHLTHSGPEGAFDAMPKAMKRTKRGVMVPGKQIRVLTKDFAPGGAFDTARYATDEASEEESDVGSGLTLERLKLLARKLSPEAWAAMHTVFNENDDDGAADEPPDFEGKPEVGKGPPAMDSAAGRRFAEMYPGASQIKTDTMGIQPRPRHVTTSAKAVARFEEMYPDAMRIKPL